MLEPLALESRNFINGEWHVGLGGRRTVLNPSTGAPCTEVTEVSVAQLQEAVAAARAAFLGWRQRSPLDRAQFMKRIAALVKRDALRLAQIVVMEQGKPMNEALGEVGGTAEFLITTPSSHAEFKEKFCPLMPPESRSGSKGANRGCWGHHPVELPQCLGQSQGGTEHDCGRYHCPEAT